jgi:hypothetical protein
MINGEHSPIRYRVRAMQCVSLPISGGRYTIIERLTKRIKCLYEA